MLRRSVLGLAWVLVFLPVWRSSLAAPLQEQTASPAEVQQELLGDMGSSRDSEYAVSSDGRRVAWRDKRDEGWAVMINGERDSGDYQKVENIRFSPDGRRLSFKARLRKNWHFVVDGEPGAAYDKVDTFDFTLDGKRFGYRSKLAGKWVMVGGGQSLMPSAGENRSHGEPYDELGPPRFSDDGRRLAYRAKRNKKEMIVVDGAPGPAYDDVGDPIFSPDSQHLIYPAKREKKWVVVEDGEEQGLEMKEIWRGDLRLKDQRLVTGLPWAYFHPKEGPIYFGRVDKGWSLNIAGVAGPEFDAVTWPVFWGGDERHYTYAGAAVKGTWTGVKGVGQVIVDSEAGPVYEGKNTKTSGGSGYADFGGSALANALASALVAGVAAAIEHGTDRSGYESGIGLAQGALRSFRARSFGVSSPQLSPNGKRIAYAARRDDEDYVVVLDGEIGPAFESIECGPIFTPKGTLVYVGVKEDKLVLVREGELVSEFSWEDADCTQLWTAVELGGSRPPISRSNYWGAMQRNGDSVPESDHVVYVGARDDKRRVFIDGIPGKEYDAEAVMVKTHVIGDKLHVAYVMVDGNEAASFIVDDQEARQYDQVFPQTLQFSKDGTVTYVARVASRFFRMTHWFR